MSVVNLNDVKAAGNFKTTDSDQGLQQALNAAESMIVKKIGPLAPTSVSEVVDGRSYHLRLNKFPFASLTSVVDWNGGPIDVSLLYVDAGLVRFINPYVWFWQHRYTVTYSIGFSTLPDPVMEAVVELTRHLWRPRMGNAVRGTANADSTPMPYALPNRVLEYLTPYVPLPDA